MTDKETGKAAAPDQPETQKVLDELARSNNAKGRGTKQQQVARRRFIVLLSLFAPVLAVLGLLAYGEWQLTQQLASFEQGNQSLQQELRAELQAQQALTRELEQQLQSLESPPQVTPYDDSGLRRANAELQQRLQALQSLVTELQSREPLEAEVSYEWKINEAAHLLTMANQQLQFQRNVPTAVQLLQLADRALVDSSLPSVLTARQAVADDLAALQGLALPDTDGLYVQLEALKAELAGLDLLSSMREEFAQRSQQSSSPVALAGSSSWIGDTVEYLGSVFVLRRWDENPDAMLQPGQDALIRQNMQLAVSRAQHFLLQGDNDNYSQSLSDLRHLLQTYVSGDGATLSALQQNLDELGNVDLEIPLPSLDSSLRAVNRLLARQQ